MVGFRGGCLRREGLDHVKDTRYLILRFKLFLKKVIF